MLNAGGSPRRQLSFPLHECVSCRQVKTYEVEQSMHLVGMRQGRRAHARCSFELKVKVDGRTLVIKIGITSVHFQSLRAMLEHLTTMCCPEY